MAGNDIAIDAALDSILGEDPGNARSVTTNANEYLTVYSTLTGEEKQILKLDARRVLRKRRPDGQLAHWAPGMPGDQPKARKGGIKCYLHPEFDELDGPSKMDREWIDTIGLEGQFCNSGDPSNKNRGDFTSTLIRDRHMRMRHKDEWQIIQDSRAAAEREREAAERRADREAMLALAGGSTAQRKPAPKE